jgi:uncharacterized repeat protein (TIGR01451 family)/fimbrial isopeptide formation D2 family protein
MKALRMLDARVNYPTGAQTALNARLEAAHSGLTQARTFAGQMNSAAQALRTTGIPGLTLSLSPYTAGVEVIRNERGSLTGPSAASSTTIVRNFLTLRGDVFGLSASDVNDMVVLGDSAGGSSGLRMLRMEQQINGRPIFQSETRFILKSNGQLMQGAGRLVPHARSFAGAITGANFMPPGDALRALMSVEHKIIDPAKIVAGSIDATHAELTVPGDDYIAGTIYARQVLFPLAPGLLVPAWSLYVSTTGPATWYAVVDSETGAVLWRKNAKAYVSAHDARFRVYVQADGVTPADSPSPASPNAFAVGSGTQPAAIPPTIVSMHTAMDPLASPNGWIDDCPGGICTANETQTLGNNTLTCLDRVTPADICDTAANSVLDGNGRPTGNPDANARNRDFLGTAPRDFQTNFLPPPQGGNPEAGQTASLNGNNGTLPVDQFRRGAVTHLFYLTNWYHDKLFQLGFDEASGNFQQTNFSGQGTGGDRVLGDAQDNEDVNNANFSTPPDGVSGRMQMFRFTGPTIDRDGGLDAEVVLHELTHGTSNRLVGDAAGLNWDPAAGMGEGWSDFFALSLLNNTNADNPDGRYASGGYATYKLLAGYLDNYVYGIRRFGYSTDNTVDPLTWADVDDVTNSMSGGIPVSPINFNGNGGMEVHNIGEVWALTLWEMRSRIIADPAGANGDVPTGNHTSLQLVTDGLKMTPIDPRFTDARDAILNADCATNACANEDSIWGAFADRELGYGAYTPYYLSFSFFSSHMAIRTSTALPYLDVVNPLTDVTIDDSADNNNGAIDPGEAIKLTVKLTNPWRRSTKAVTSATATLTSSTPGVTIYDNTSTYGAIAPQGTATGDTFTITVAPSVTAGTTLSFDLAIVSNLGNTNASFTVRVGTRNGTDAPVTYTATPNIAIPDGNQLGAKSPLTVTDDYEIADLDFRIDSVSHTYVGDLNIMLRSASAVGTDSVGLVGVFSNLDAYGSAGHDFTNMVIDDEATTGDMFDAPDTDAPYTGTYFPIYNSPSWAAFFGVPGDPKGNLSYHDGSSTKGTWTALAADHAQPDAGTLNTWSMIVTPVHFDVAAFAAGATVTGTKTVAGTFQVGGTVTYTITLTNNGTANQADNTGNEYTDLLPAGLTLVSANATSGTAGMAGNTATWDGALAPLGGTTTITITATVNAGTQGTVISNQGTIAYDADNDGTNEASTTTDDPSVGGANDPTVFTVANANVSGTKTASGTFTNGSTVTYTVTLNNSGNTASPDNAGNEFSDTLPAGVTLVSAIASSGTAGTAANTVTWNGSVPAGGSVTITITATVNSATPGTVVTNQGTINFDADLNGSNESSTTTDDPSVGGANDATSFTVQGATLSATKTASGSFTVGSTVTYTVTISNTGNAASLDNAGNEFTDVLPSSLTLVSANATSGTAGMAANTATWNGTVAAGGTVTITITATINSGTQGSSISNQGSLSYDANLDGTNESSAQTDDPAVGGASDPTTFTVGGATISATKTVSGTFNPNGAITYTITVNNSGASATSDNAGNELTDVLPASLTLVSASASSGAAVATVGTNTVTWNGGVAAGGSVTITINATIKSTTTAGTVVSNQATIAYDADVNGGNESSTTSDDPSVGGTNDPTTFTVNGPVVTATKTRSGSTAVGGAVTYTITLTNSGNAATADNPGNEFTDVLPAELTLVSASASSGAAVATVGTNTVTWNGSIGAASSVTITINATVDPGTQGATVSNQGSFSYDGDGNGTNESSGLTDDPSVAGASNPTTFVATGAVDTVTKTVAGSFTTGSNVTYTITIHNSGNIASGDNPGNELTDVLPAELTLVSANASSGTATATVATNTVTWNGSVPAGGDVTITIVATIEPGHEGATISNQATLIYDNNGDGTNETTTTSDSPAAGGTNDPTTFDVAAAALVTPIPTASELGLLMLALGLAALAAWKISLR